jgi:BirA family biotin operon repressor/biotin-[acetyl-CoA-carboxylase] ligase
MFISLTNSTNNYLKKHPDCDDIWTSWQTAGRGQAGNSWESEQGKNVLMSLRLRKPQVAVEQAFLLQMAVSLGVQEVVANLLPNRQVTIKWPNDIYVDNKKICGILIESTIADGQLTEAIAGIGLNVNQTVWQSNAPNPVSLKQLTGMDYDLPTIYEALYKNINNKLSLLSDIETLKQQYRSVLYRFGQKSLYALREVSMTPSRILTDIPENAFEATITDITPQGQLVLETATGSRMFHFKEIQFVL